MSCRVAVVANPAKVADLAELKSAVAQRCGGEFGWWETTVEDPGAGQARAALADGAELVLVCGGDGTTAACAGALADTGVAMALVPSGTGNLLARNLDLPLELPASLDIAFGEHERRLDVLDTGELRYVVMAGLGFDAALIRDTDEKLKARVGWLAYLGGLRRAIKARRRTQYLISIDDQPAVRRRAIGVLVANVGQLQGGITLLPDARPDDGELDVITLSPRSAVDWPVLIGRILGRRPDSGRQADTWRGRTVRISAGHPVPFEYDGDFIGERSELAVEVLPGALRLRCPAPAVTS
ncbi:MAG TPA: diacylglycerol kinase family protein [Jatrophihabitans sp.]|jgi:diacylglycerol kinase family enzyme|nr:diacylglycerol kinase family protein [Jatrophihabitans sp.]